MDRVSLNKISQIIQGEPAVPGLMASDVEGISIDSRTIRPGDLFFAVQGKRLDGHQFVADAFAQGAQACVVNRGFEAAGLSQPLICVENVNLAFQKFAHWYRRQQQATVIGVTGSVGKTTARAMIHTVLAPFLKGVQSPANYNNEFGVPLSIAQIESGHQYAVLELGASLPGEIRELARLSQPEIGVITGIGPSHLEHFGTLEQTAAAKGELFEALPESGFAILNGDDVFASSLAEKTSARKWKVGLGEQNDLQAVAVHLTGNGLSFQADGSEFLIPVFGKHFVYPALFAIAVAKEFGLSNQDLIESFRLFATIPGRCHIEQTGSWTIIDDSYNSSPASMAAACQVLNGWTGGGKRIMVMGDMLELGAESKRYHQEIGALIAASGIDYLFVCGKQAAAVVQGALSGKLSQDRIVQATDVEELQSDVISRLEPGDVVLVKGSRGMRMERLITGLKQQAGQTDSQQATAREMKSCV
tara:strand:- start:2428 stop:3849 length:1422 start_codon:yes stop_codon:yes gene_type:complete